jgi:hypothetical protein
MSSSGNQAVLLCPKCFAMANPAFVSVDGEILWWLCRECNFQGVLVDFIELTDQTGPTGQNNKEV